MRIHVRFGFGSGLLMMLLVSAIIFSIMFVDSKKDMSSYLDFQAKCLSVDGILYSEDDGQRCFKEELLLNYYEEYN